MQRKPIILLMLLTMSGASRAATDDFDPLMGVGWVWILALSLYGVITVILLLAFCKTAADSDALEEKTYKAILKQAEAAAGANLTGGVAVAAAARSRSNRPPRSDRGAVTSIRESRIAARWSPRPDGLDLNLADFAPQGLDIHILDSEEIVVRDVVAPEVRKRA